MACKDDVITAGEQVKLLSNFLKSPTVCIRTYIHICTHTYVRVCILYINTYVYMYICVCTYVHMCMYVCTYIIDMYTYTHVCVDALYNGNYFSSLA